jgi:hypothetical protein
MKALVALGYDPVWIREMEIPKAPKAHLPPGTYSVAFVHSKFPRNRWPSAWLQPPGTLQVIVPPPSEVENG